MKTPLGRTFMYFTAALAISTCNASPGHADELVTVDGQRYVRQGDKLYPQTRQDWTDTRGVVHELWTTDYSKWIAPKAVAMKTTESKPYPDHNPVKEESSRTTPSISVRDVGCKHYLTIGADMLFDFDKATLNPKAEKVLGQLGPMIKNYGAHPVTIEGHTDAIGTDEYNQTLSEERAQTVRDWLAAHDFVQQSASINGFGKTRPIAPNTYNDGTDYPQGRAKNRRVKVYVDTCE